MRLVEALIAHLSQASPAARAEGVALAQRSAPRPERLATLRALLDASDAAAHLDGALDLAALGDAVLRDWLQRACWIHAAHRLVWLHHLLGHPLPPDLYATLCDMLALTATAEGGLPPDAGRRVALGQHKHRLEGLLRPLPAQPPPLTRALPWRMAEALSSGQDASAFWATQLADQRVRAVSGSLSLLAPWHASPARLGARFAEVSAFRALEVRWRSDWAALRADPSPERLQQLDRDQRHAFSQAATGSQTREARQFRRYFLALALACPAFSPSSAAP